MTRSQLALPGPEPVSEFKRVRTKFTVEQIRELEALFTVHGPHPSREQRLAVAEKINVYVFTRFSALPLNYSPFRSGWRPCY